MRLESAIAIMSVCAILLAGLLMGWFDPKIVRVGDSINDKRSAGPIYVDAADSSEPLRPRDICQSLCQEILNEGRSVLGRCLSEDMGGFACETVGKGPESGCGSKGKRVVLDTKCGIIK